jgi:adenylylsulfate kinase-like enzyme
MKSTKRGFVLWLTGLSGSGKTTLAYMLEKELREKELPVDVLDGDEIRANFSKDLGFSRLDRETNTRRIGFMCDRLRRHGIVAIVAAISPYRKVRDEV